MVTQKDISAACGVSISAVSKALGDYPDISEDTKRRIRDAAERMGYHAMKNELIVKREHTYIVGLLITGETERESCQNVIRELRKVLVGKGYDLVLLSPEGERGRKEKKAERPGYLPRARLYGMEGVFLFSDIEERDLYYQEDFRDLRELILGEIPVVSIGSFFASCRCVLPSYDRRMRNLINEICGRGHRRIAFVFKERMQNYGMCCKTIRSSLIENRLKLPESYLREVRTGTAREAFMQTMDLLQG
ncbi:MAG: LacI family DNA-binding transcriptional regulator, partial [Lachnospira sp.]|nr:LacI family DNA-binding transcriptional regulator [Lachnospira sp.]